MLMFFCAKSNPHKAASHFSALRFCLPLTFEPKTFSIMKKSNNDFRFTNVYGILRAGE